MELINYLNQHYLTRDELLDLAKINHESLKHYQDSHLMPVASYRLQLQLTSDSFFGVHEEQDAIEYYAKGYVSWLGIISTRQDAALLYQEFVERYTNTLEHLKTLGHQSDNPKLNSGLCDHLAQEWQYFLQGIYGLCTKTGLPEDIAAKEFAVIQINELIDNPELSHSELAKLENAVNLLDSASSAFAPHERSRSSRHRLVDDVRRKYRLSPN